MVVGAALDLQVDQQHDPSTDHRPDPTGRLDEAVTAAKKDPAEKATDEGTHNSEQNRLQDAHRLPSRDDRSRYEARDKPHDKKSDDGSDHDLSHVAEQ